MDGTAFGDVHQPLPLVVVEVADELDLAVDLVDHALGGLAGLAVLGMNT